MQKIVIKEFELDDNPPLIEEGSWNEVVKTLKQMIKNREIGGGLLSIQRKCDISTMEQVQRGSIKNVQSKDRERLLKVAILKTEYTYSYNWLEENLIRH